MTEEQPHGSSRELVIVGARPAGLAAALELLRLGDLPLRLRPGMMWRAAQARIRPLA